ncbi:efflux RND transporter periplasmic adaptor subunit [bacterium]|nr:efflux RND transporter periplasmic adaptor subunit [bacterium]
MPDLSARRPRAARSPARTIAGTGVFALMVSLAACSEKESVADVQPGVAAPVVEVIEARPINVGDSLRVSGLTGYVRETILSFGAPGQIETLSVDEGDVVAAGARLATLRRTTVGADAEEAEVARRTAEQQLARVETLFEKGFASQAALDNARLAVQRAREGASIFAPASGVVLRRHAEPAQIVSAGQPVLTIGENRFGMVLRAPVSSADAARLSVGAAATVKTGASPPRPAEVSRIAAKSADATGTFEVEVRIKDAGGLRSGEVAEASIARQSEDGAQMRFIVPALSLVDARADQGQVYVVDSAGVARRRSVETGGLNSEGVIVLKGLAEGDRVVTAGATTVRDGEPVRITGAE